MEKNYTAKQDEIHKQLKSISQLLEVMKDPPTYDKEICELEEIFKSQKMEIGGLEEHAKGLEK